MVGWAALAKVCDLRVLLLQWLDNIPAMRLRMSSVQFTRQMNIPNNNNRKLPRVAKHSAAEYRERNEGGAAAAAAQQVVGMLRVMIAAGNFSSSIRPTVRHGRAPSPSNWCPYDWCTAYMETVIDRPHPAVRRRCNVSKHRQQLQRAAILLDAS